MGERNLNAITDYDPDEMLLPDGSRLTPERAAEVGQRMIDAGRHGRENAAEGSARS